MYLFDVAWYYFNKQREEKSFDWVYVRIYYLRSWGLKFIKVRKNAISLRRNKAKFIKNNLQENDMYQQLYHFINNVVDDF